MTRRNRWVRFRRPFRARVADIALLGDHYSNDRATVFALGPWTVVVFTEEPTR